MCVQVTYAGLIEDMFESMQQVSDPALAACPVALWPSCWCLSDAAINSGHHVQIWMVPCCSLQEAV